MQNLFLFLKGFLVGIGKIIPGVSGSMIATLLHIYEDSIYAINHLKDDFKKSVLYLFPIGFGVVLAITLFSKVLLFFLNHYSFFTMTFFVGLILGTVPCFRKTFSFEKKRDFLFFVIGFCLPLLATFFEAPSSFAPQGSFSSFAFIFFLGFLDALSMVIPGVSGTALFLMFGSYTFLLTLFQNPFAHFSWAIFFGFGLIFGIFLISRFVEYCFSHYKNQFLILVYGLLWSSILSLFSLCFVSFQWNQLFFFVFFLFLGFLLASFFSK